MVGGWSLRKGCDLLARLVETGKYTLLHVGSMVDMQYPDTDCFTHIDSVDQKELVRYYNKAKVFILPSREEGLAMVQAQAICCNLPIVGSLDSGAEDLKRMVEAPENILIIPEHTLEAVVETVKSAMLQYSTLSGKIYAGKVKDELSWNAYGKRYAGMLRK